MPAWLDALKRTHPALLRERSREALQDLDADVAQAAAPLAEDAAALRAFLADHIGGLWTAHLAAEWARVGPPLRGMTAGLAREHAGSRHGHPDRPGRTPARSARLGAGGARRSDLAHLCAFAACPIGGRPPGQARRVHVFARFDPALMRRAHVRRVEVVGPLSALADDTRLRLLEALAASGEARGQDLIAGLGVSQPNVSRHLKQLLGAGLVEERRAGDANKLYRLEPARLANRAIQAQCAARPGRCPGQPGRDDPRGGNGRPSARGSRLSG